MPIVRFKLKRDDKGERRIFPEGFKGALYVKVVKGDYVMYGYASEEVLNGLTEEEKNDMELVEINSLDDLYNEVKGLLQYDEQGNQRTEEQIKNVIKRDIARYSIMVDSNGNFVE